jgi:ATPase subunit of ABC transporter with duplicated ATPase domains
MCVKGFTKMFGSSRTERVAQMAAQDQQAKAMEALREALRPANDNEQARKAAESRQRRMASMRGVRSAVGAGGRGDMAAPSVGLKMLLGS